MHILVPSAGGRGGGGPYYRRKPPWVSGLGSAHWGPIAWGWLTCPGSWRDLKQNVVVDILNRHDSAPSQRHVFCVPALADQGHLSEGQFGATDRGRFRGEEWIVCPTGQRCPLSCPRLQGSQVSGGRWREGCRSGQHNPYNRLTDMMSGVLDHKAAVRNTSTPPPLSFPTPGKTVPHHRRSPSDSPPAPPGGAHYHRTRTCAGTETAA